MNKNENIIPVDWKEKVRNFTMSTKPAETLPILQALVKERNKEGIQWFYKHICTDTLDISDRDEFFYKFINWFSNMEKYSEIKENKEPTTGNHFLCFRCIYHRGENDEFYTDIFFRKKEIVESPYRYHQFLMYNNLVGFETFLHTYEFEKPIFKEENMIQCNNIVLSFKWENTEYEKHLNPPLYLSWDWYEVLKEKFDSLGLNFRNVLSNGDELIVVLDLYRTLNLKNRQLCFVLEEVKKKLFYELKEFHIYDNQNFFMVPGSINSRNKKNLISNKNNMFFSARKLIDNNLVKDEFSYRKCYMLGDDYFNTGIVSLTSIANIFHMEKKETKDFNTKIHKNNFVKYKKVGEERLKDFDTLLLYRNFKIKDNFLFMSIIANILFYLNKNEIEVMIYLNEKNNLLVNPLTYSQLVHILEFNKKNFEIYKSNPNLGIKYSNDTIVKKLSITEEEQDKMLQLISKETAELRTQYHKREYARKQYKEKKIENQEKKNQLNQEISKLFDSGFSKKEISEKLNQDIRKIKEVVGDNKEDFILQIKEQISLGLSVQEISDNFHISKKKIYRIIKE